jgi:penicillin-binding protein 2
MFGQYETSPGLRRRLNWCSGAALACLGLLIVRLWFLQVLHGDELRTLSESNRIRLRRVQATRGTILDRYGRALVDSRASFDALLVPEDAPDLEATVETLAHFLKQTAADTQALLRHAQERAPFHEIVVKRDLDWEEVVALEAHQLDLPGVSIRITPRRSYPLGPVLAHVLGYVGEATPHDLERDPRYRPGDLIGKTGLEKVWERHLRGVNGGQQVEVDAVGRELRVLQEVQEVPGNTLVLSIDLDLQQVAEAALGDEAGAVVVLDPRTGEILSMVSRPSFDPNVFARGIGPREWRELTEHPRRPLLHRAIQGQYPPGSTFKIAVAVAALEEGVINPFTGIGCGGGVQFGNHYFRCWRKQGHGTMNVHEALVNSCDTFFYQVAQRLGIEAIAKSARLFGLGAASGLGLEHERAGIVPDAAWKRRRLGEPWYAGETLSVAIGQGYVTATPLQMAQLVGALATGTRYRPHLVRHVESPDGDVLEAAQPEPLGTLPVRALTLTQVRDALADVVARGTGKNARLRVVSVAGKTGTSQVVKLGRERVKAHALPWQQRDHAWFVAYAPAEEPTVALAVLVEHAPGGGGAVAAPIAQRVLEAYFRLQADREPARYAQN